MTDYFETKSQPITLRIPKMLFSNIVTKQEEPCEGRLSSTVLWEREGETPSRDPTSQNAGAIVLTLN